MPAIKLKNRSDRIRQLHATGLITMQELADAFGVSRTAIFNVVRGKTYRTN